MRPRSALSVEVFFVGDALQHRCRNSPVTPFTWSSNGPPLVAHMQQELRAREFCDTMEDRHGHDGACPTSNHRGHQGSADER